MDVLARIRSIWLIASVFVSACAANPTPLAPPNSSPNVVAPAGTSPNLKTPALITLNTQNGDLEYWPIRPNGGDRPQQVSQTLGIFQVYGMAANGNVVAIASYSPSEIVTYDVESKASKVLPDPAGGAVDVAIGKDGIDLRTQHPKRRRVSPRIVAAVDARMPVRFQWYRRRRG